METNEIMLSKPFRRLKFYDIWNCHITVNNILVLYKFKMDQNYNQFDF